MMKEDAFCRCHPIINLFYFVGVLVFTMFVQHPIFLIISFLGATSYGMWLLGVKKVLKMNFLITLPALIIVALVNPMFNHYGVTPLYYIESSGNWVTLESMVYGIVLGCVMFIVIEWFSCYNQVMTSDKFIYLFGRIIPAMSLMLSMALRFVPLFANQLKIIRNGQKCVGMDTSNAKFLKKIQYALNLLSILVTWALENAIETADSMKSRGYGLPGRTAFSIYHFDKRDKIVGGLFLVLSIIFTYGCYKGAAYAQYNPCILLAGFTVQGNKAPVECSNFLVILTFVSFAIFCFIPLVLSVVEEMALRRSQREIGKEMDITYRNIYEELARE